MVIIAGPGMCVKKKLTAACLLLVALARLVACRLLTTATA